MKSFALILLALVPLAAAAQPPMPPPPSPTPVTPTIKLPDKVTIPAGKFCEIKAETTGKTVKWIVLTKGLSVHVCGDGQTIVVTGLPGIYDVVAYTSLNDVLSEPARVTIVIGDPPPPPAPPVPPAPPTPPDPLKAKLAAAFAAAAGTAEQKREWAKDLAALYRAAAKLSIDPTITTASMLKSKLSVAAETLIGDMALVEVRKAVAGELAAVLPATDGELTSDQRTAAASLFSRLSTILEVIAP